MLAQIFRLQFCALFTVLYVLIPTPIKGQSFFDETSTTYFSTPMGFRKILESLKIEDGLPELQVVRALERVHPGSGYLVQTLELEAPGVSSFKIHIRHPQKVLTQEPRPVLFILAGITSNEATLELFPREDQAVLVVFEYDFDKSNSVQSLQELPQMIASAPVQIASAIKWVQAQSWAQNGQFNTLAISLGTLFLPLSQRILLYNNIKIDATVLAYGGADLSLFLEEFLAPNLGEKELKIALDVLTPLLRPVDPAVHLPLLRSRFLIVHATEDEVIPGPAIEQLSKLTPEPKEFVIIPGGHINTDRWDLIEALGTATITWLKKIDTL